MSRYPWWDLPSSEAVLTRLGAAVRRARYRMGLSQLRLEELSSVDQTMISRLERAKAPGLAIRRFVLLTDALGSAFPLGSCPHDHACAWQEPTDRSTGRVRPSGDDDLLALIRHPPPPLYPGSLAWQRIHASARSGADAADDLKDATEQGERPDTLDMAIPPTPRPRGMQRTDSRK